VNAAHSELFHIYQENIDLKARSTEPFALYLRF
jgi:hypothetical protein